LLRDASGSGITNLDGGGSIGGIIETTLAPG